MCEKSHGANRGRTRARKANLLQGGNWCAVTSPTRAEKGTDTLRVWTELSGPSQGGGMQGAEKYGFFPSRERKNKKDVPKSIKNGSPRG